jgi:hypothetical protein
MADTSEEKSQPVSDKKLPDPCYADQLAEFRGTIEFLKTLAGSI